MNKKCISVSVCEPGDIIAQKIVSKYGAIIAVENTMINKYIKSKLFAFEIEYIWVYGTAKEESLTSVDTTLSKVKENYVGIVRETKDIINELARGEKINVGKMDLVSNSIYTTINHEYYLIKCLSELRTTDQYSYNHSVNVSFYGMLLGKWLYLSENEIKEVVQAGLLHDIGKTKIPLTILNKKDKLQYEEFEEIKKHPIYGYRIVENMGFISKEVKEAILMHHERVNHSGYPLGKSGDELGIYSKIIAIADVYDAITSERVYKKRATPFEAFQIIQNESLDQFDIHIMNTFLGNLAACYIGSKVMLSNGEQGEILYVPPHAITQPIISVGDEYIDLSKTNDIKIEAMI